jgi:RimJ/RimL family protein N-acetyltransferase
MSDQVALRPVAEDDLDVLDRFVMEPEAVGPFEWHGWYKLKKLRDEWDENRLISDDGGRLMIVRGDDPIGFVSYRRAWENQSSYCWDFGIALLPEARGKGYGTEAQRLLVRYLFAHSMVERVQATTRVENIAEQRALEKAGFTREGILRSITFQGGQWRDGVLYSVLRHEVPMDQPPP